MDQAIELWVRGVLIDEMRITNEEYFELWSSAAIVAAEGGLKGDISEAWVKMGFKDKLNDLYL